MADVPIISVLAAGIANLLLGSVWYHPRVFGAAWARLSNITPEMAERGTRRTLLYSALALISGMLTAFVLAQFIRAWGADGFSGAAALALWSWAGFVVPTSLGAVLWEHKPLPLYLINTGYWLVSFIIISLIISF